MTQQQHDRLIELLWDYLKRDPVFPDRRKTGWGTKTKKGLVVCIERVIHEETHLKPH